MTFHFATGRNRAAGLALALRGELAGSGDPDRYKRSVIIKLLSPANPATKFEARH